MKKILIIMTLVFLLLLVGCTQTVKQVANEEYVNHEVKVSGTATKPLKLGDLSGYTLVDSNGDQIIVATERLPAEGDNVIAKGTLQKGPFGGYFIEVK